MKRLFFITIGSILFAVGFAIFIEPVNIAPGGISGIVVILSRLFPTLNTGLLFLLLNVPLLIIGALTFGGKFFFGTVYATLISSLTMGIIPYIHTSPIFFDSFLMLIVGSVVSGIGLAIVFRVDATTGGTDIIARLIHRRNNKASLGWIFFALDTVVVASAGIVFGEIEIAVQSAFSAATMAFVFNIVLNLKFSGLFKA